MKWKVIVQGDEPSEQSIRILTEHTGLLMDKILMAFSHEDDIVCNGLSEGEAQKIVDSFRRDPGIHCRILPDHEEQVKPVPLFRVLLVNYRPGYRTRLRRRLQRLTRLPQEQVVLWLSRMPIALSKGIDKETARSIKKSITEAGGIVRIEADSILQESVSPGRRSNAVFRTREVTLDSGNNLSDTLSGGQTDTIYDDVSKIPPVSGLPEQYSVGPPPIDEFETSSGRIFLQPPARYTVGLPSKSQNGGFLESPPVLPDVSNRCIPEIIEFSAPLILNEDAPPVVGNGGGDLSQSGPSPDTVILYAPPGNIFQHLLLPPVLKEFREDIHSTADDSPDGAPTDNGLKSHTDEPVASNGIDDAMMRLFLYIPAPADEARVAVALREVLGVSLRESWDLLKETPALLETCADHRKAIKTAHELDALGVTVSLTRGNLTAGATSVSAGEGFQAWLSNNG